MNGFQNYEEFRNYIMHVKYFDIPTIGKMSIIEAVSFMTNLLVFPAIFFQMMKTWRLKQTTDFNPYFLLLQLFGGAPEGMIGFAIGNLIGNTQMMAIGLYAMFYNAYMLFFRCFGKKGLIKSMF
jgi:hypothetical protein